MLEINNLTKIYGSGDISVTALNNVSFKIQKGEYVAIIGPSGSGKSTLMNILGCLDTPTKGEYVLEGMIIKDLKGNKLAEIRNKLIGFVFQSFNLLSRQSALKNVELAMIYGGVKRNERKRRAKEALEKVGLGDRIKHKSNELSGGQIQRVAIARAIVNNPAIILADEPTGNLDSKSATDVLNIFRQLNSEGKTIILITHENEVARSTDRILTFKDGVLKTDEYILKGE